MDQIKQAYDSVEERAAWDRYVIEALRLMAPKRGEMLDSVKAAAIAAEAILDERRRVFAKTGEQQ